MAGRFEQLKRRAQEGAFLRYGAVGGSVALFSFGLLYTLAALDVIALACYWAMLIGIAAGFVVGGTLAALFFPTTKRFARYLDEEYALDEKVQTMVQFASREGEIVQMQRQSTEALLQELPKKRKVWQSLTAFIALPILAISMVITPFFIPEKKPSAPPPDKTVAVYYDGAEAIKQLKPLIANVKAAKWQKEESSTWKDLQPAYVASLEGLLQLLEEGKSTEEEVQASVFGGMNAVIALTKEKNTYNAYLEAAKGNAVLKSFSRGLREGGKGYKKLTEINVFDFSSLEKKDEALFQAVSAILGQYASAVEADIVDLKKEEFIDYITEYVKQLGDLLTATALQKDGLTDAIATLKGKLAKTLENLSGGFGLEDVKGQVITALEGFYGANESASGGIPLSGQAYSYMMKDYVLNGLDHIFGWGIPHEEEVGEEEDVEGGTGGGSVGEGELAYPNAGTVLDPSKGELTQYTNLIQDYYKRVMDLLSENEEISEELRQALTAYFEGLQVK